MKEINKLRRDHAIDLSGWDANSYEETDASLALPSDNSDQADDFFEVMPAMVADSTDNIDRARFLVILGVVLAAVALGLLAWAIVVVAIKVAS